MNNNYSSNDYFQSQNYMQHLMLKNNMKKALRKAGSLVGLAIILYVVIQNLAVFAMEVFGMMEKYESNQIYAGAVDILFIIFGLLLPFVLLAKPMKNNADYYAYQSSQLGMPMKKTNQLILGKPKSVFDAFLAVIAGLGICMAANILTGIFTVFMSAFGYELSSPDIAMPKGVAGIFVTVLKVSILTGVVEELALRGYVMGSVRVFGDKFAIGVTAVVFALMHGNLVQSPFALIAGFALGYFAIKTSSLWTAIVIHLLNNLISVVITYLYDYIPEEQINIIYYALIFSLMILGAIALVILLARRKDVKVQDPLTVMTTREKAIAFFFNVPMLIAMGYMIYVTSQFIN